MRRAESDYWKRTLNESSGPKDVWRIVKHAQRKNDKKKPIGPLYDANGELLKDDEKKAECFDEYFVGIGANLAKDHVPVNEKEVTRFITKVTPTISEILINPEIVRKSIAKKLKLNKAMGPDEISPKTLLLLGSTVDSGLFYIFFLCKYKKFTMCATSN